MAAGINILNAQDAAARMAVSKPAGAEGGQKVAHM